MHSPPDQRAVGSPRSLAPLGGFDVELPQTPIRGAAPRHSQEVTQPAPNTRKHEQKEMQQRFSQKPTQPMEWAPEITQPTATNVDYQPQVMVTEASAQYQQTGECRMAHIIEAAQLTQIISSTDEVDMQPNPPTPRPDTRGIATPRRRIGGRCRKWVVSTQANSKRTCAACTMCHHQFSPGEPRLQQWSNRNAARHYVDAQCVTGGLKSDHELVPKNPTDNEAKDAVIRIRDNIFHAAADVGVVLPVHDPHDDSSTDTSEDEDTWEEALRHDDAIMDFQWFSTISWTEIKDLRRTTYVQLPTRLRFALQQAQHAILRAILHNEPSSPTSEPAWKVLLFSSWLLLGRPAENASDANCASFLETRLDLFWSEDWPALWALVRAERDVPAITQTRLRTKAETRVRKVATLARAGEKGRALAAARNAPPVPVTRDIVQEITSLYPVDPDPAVPSTARVSVAFTAEVMDFIPITLKRMPRLSEP